MIAVNDAVDRGAMIELRVDNDRTTQRAPLHVGTPLTAEPPAAIVAPPQNEVAEAAAALQEGLAHRIGSHLPLLDEAGFAGAQALPRHLIAPGNAANNALLRRVHDLQHLRDANCPVDELRVISIHSPLR